jgi:hypothetical protein
MCNDEYDDELAALPNPVAGFSSTLLSIADAVIPEASSSPKNIENHGMTMIVNRLLLSTKSSASVGKQREYFQPHQPPNTPSKSQTHNQAEQTKLLEI